MTVIVCRVYICPAGMTFSQFRSQGLYAFFPLEREEEKRWEWGCPLPFCGWYGGERTGFSLVWSWLYSRHHMWLLFVEGCSLFCWERFFLPVSEFSSLCKNQLFNFQFNPRELDESLWDSTAGNSVIYTIIVFVLAIWSCLACIRRVMDACGKLLITREA